MAEQSARIREIRVEDFEVPDLIGALSILAPEERPEITHTKARRPNFLLTSARRWKSFQCARPDLTIWRPFYLR